MTISAILISNQLESLVDIVNPDCGLEDNKILGENEK